MIPDPHPRMAKPEQVRLDLLSNAASDLSFDLVEIAGVVEDIHQANQAIGEVLGRARNGAELMVSGNGRVREAVASIRDTAAETLQSVETSSENIHNASEHTRDLAAWVQSLGDRVTRLEEVLKTVSANNADIISIARHINILAINAKIEAARAGDAGKGFAVVAEAINDLSGKTAGAANRITGSISGLVDWVEKLRGEADTYTQNARRVLTEADQTNSALSDISGQVHEVHERSRQIHRNAEAVRQAIADFQADFSLIGNRLEQTSAAVATANSRTDNLVEKAERILQHSVAMGGVTDDAALIAEVQARAAQISATFEAGLERGEISRNTLFDHRYLPIPGSAPPQFMAPFTEFADRVLPPIQEPALECDARIVFCAAVDRNGYLPTHNRKFSHPQGDDPDWNMAHSRNRRIFDDRVGLKAGRNQLPFLLQVYRRDMGGGKFVTMNDLSAPILVNGKHWGGLRLAYRP